MDVVNHYLGEDELYLSEIMHMHAWHHSVKEVLLGWHGLQVDIFSYNKYTRELLIPPSGIGH